MGFSEISVWEWQTTPISVIGRDKMILLASAGGVVNGMTVAWGGFGVMWGEPCIHFAIRPSRFTHHLAEAGESFALCSLPKERAAALTYFGTHSGREGDKFSSAGITPITMPCGGAGICEASLVITARKMLAHTISTKDFFDPEVFRKWYPTGDLHTLYFAKVSAIYIAD